MEILLYNGKGSYSSGKVEWALNFDSIPYQRVEATVTARILRIMMATSDCVLIWHEPKHKSRGQSMTSKIHINQEF